MAFPTIVSGTASSAEAPQKYGPFLADGVRWLFLYRNIDNLDFSFTQRIVVFKSVNAGGVWTETGAFLDLGLVDRATTPLGYTCAQSSTDPTKILIVAVDPDAGGFIGVIPFDTATGVFGSFNDGPLLNFTYDRIGTVINYAVAAYRPDDTLVVCIPQNSFTDADGVEHVFASAVVFDVTGGSWGSLFDLGYENYADTTYWHQLPCGIAVDSDGVTRVAMQQITQTVPSGASINPQFDGSYVIPWDCNEIQYQMYGAGGGGAAPIAASAGGGGGSGELFATSESVSPGDTIAGPTVGTGGAGGTWNASPAGIDGGDTSFNGHTALGGHGAPGDGFGTGGPGAHDGGAGFVGGGGGGGGAGSDTEFGSGTDGDDGTIYAGSPANGGAGGLSGGAGNGFGGAGGGYDPGNLMGGGGGSGQQPGGGGGGGAGESDGGAGADGEFSGLSYIPFQPTTENGRLWQQAIKADDSLGTLSEITSGAFPIQTFENNVVLMPFDMDANAGNVVMAFSGVSSTNGYEKINTLRGPNADPVVFVSQLITVGSSSPFTEPSPAILIDDDANGWLAYKRVSGSTRFVFREDPLGAGFGAEQGLGTFADPYCRLQLGVFDKVAEVTFGTPQVSNAGWINPT